MAIHGSKKQNERDFVMMNFRSGKVNILIATDVASRGLDVKDIEYVINFDMPKVIEDYVHRIGRTGIVDIIDLSVVREGRSLRHIDFLLRGRRGLQTGS
jgi:superfamily II DNA/RNA helicase